MIRRNIPILFIIFNRPSTTRQVFKRIRKISPENLYIAADGPRIDRSHDSGLVNETRKLTEEIDWKCTVHRLYRTENLGCGKAVSGAIDWFFKNEEMGIILEDDCLINNSFYDFMNKMLVEYKDDVRVMNISGDNFFSSKKQKVHKYYLSKFVHIWGWATWKRAWRKYDFNMNSWNKNSLYQKIKSINGNIWDKLYWTSKFDSVAYKVTNTWDYQWVYTVMKNNGLSIVPGTNLVSNIGFGNNSTHTSDSNYYLANLKSKELGINPILATTSECNKLDWYERDNIFKVKSLSTIVHFGYFSIFFMIYNRLINYNYGGK